MTHSVDKFAAEQEGYKQTLGRRHVQMIAIGGSIGTGLFVASGATISQAGPGGALLAYGCMVVTEGQLAVGDPVRAVSAS